jgi:2-methylisocitrate lyase-like PEP mutase family enzyme
MRHLPTWKELLAGDEPLLLPAAHDALTARLIELAGFRAYQVGGFALNGANHAFPDLDLVHYGEQIPVMWDILSASQLPVMIDADDGYGDAKNITRTICGYERIGASAIFFEDQQAPKKCGHMGNKKIIPARAMVDKVKAAIAARRSPDTFLIARTDAIATDGLDEALCRGEKYLKAGADGLFIEGATSEKQLRRIATNFKGVPLIANMLEGGGKTPILPPDALYAMGFAMITYPTSILFRVARAIERGCDDLLQGRKLPPHEAVTMRQFEEIVDMKSWAAIDAHFSHSGEIK